MIVEVEVSGSVGDVSFSRAIRRANERIESVAMADARRRLARHIVTGETFRGLRSRSLGEEGVMLANDAPQAWFLEFDTQPHVIRAKNARALRFVGADGDAVFAQSVNHPGTTADPFMEPSFTDNVVVFENILDAEIGSVL